MPFCLVSKAFTRESDEWADEEIRPLRPQLPAGTRNYITPPGARRLKERLDEILKKKQALTNGKSDDSVAISEGEQRKLEGRIRNLQQILQSVVVAEPPADKEKVCFGASVTVRHGNQGPEVYRIVGVEESDPEHGDISWISPLARALLSRRAGDKVHFRSPAGEQELSIVSIHYEGDGSIG
jgi:transcription elongation factor GreB